MQTFTFYASEDKLTNRGHTAGNIGYEAINQAACDLAKEVASKGDALVAGNISQVPAYLKGLGKEAVQKEFKKQTDIFVKNDVDFLIGELFRYAERAEWATEVMKATGKPVAVCLSVSLAGAYEWSSAWKMCCAGCSRGYVWVIGAQISTIVP